MSLDALGNEYLYVAFLIPQQQAVTFLVVAQGCDPMLLLSLRAGCSDEAIA